MRINSDEKYILDLISSILNTKYIWQHKFDGLLGDKGKNGIARKLSVDGYFPDYKLIVEYLEKQHFQKVKIMDRRMTISGVTRDKQRGIYCGRRRNFAKKNGYKYLELIFNEFIHFKNGKLKRLKQVDESLIKEKLKSIGLKHFI